MISMNSSRVPLRDIAAGLYDSSLRTWSQQAATWGHPFFLRWNWEMNGYWLPYSRASQPASTTSTPGGASTPATQAGASNVTWVWCPNIDRGTLHALLTGLPRRQLRRLDLPGRLQPVEQNRRGRASPRSSRPATTNCSSLRRQADHDRREISEEAGGSKASWITDALATQLPTQLPQDQGAGLVQLAQVPGNRSTTGGRGRSSPRPRRRAAFHNGIASSYYAPGGSFGNLQLLTKINPLP